MTSTFFSACSDTALRASAAVATGMGILPSPAGPPPLATIPLPDVYRRAPLALPWRCSYTSGRGIVARGGGPAGLGNIPIPVATAADARKAVSEQAEKKVDVIKLWIDDDNGKGAKLKSDAYAAAIDEAHKRNLKIVAEVFDLADAKDLVKAGIDGFE